jgi:hypothetical protein
MNVLRSMMSTWELKCVEGDHYRQLVMCQSCDQFGIAGPHIARCGATTFPKFNSRLPALASPPPRFNVIC